MNEDSSVPRAMTEPTFRDLFRRSDYPGMWVSRYYVFGAWLVAFCVFFFGSVLWTRLLALSWAVGLFSIFAGAYFYGRRSP